MRNLSRRPVKLPTPERLANIALYYLQRFSASEASLRRVLENRLRRAAMRNAEWAADAETQKKLHTAIETIIEKYRKTGVLNDAAFAESKVHSLRRSGLSKRAIAQKLNAKGIPKNLIETSLDTSEDDGMDDTERDLKAARVFARKKRFGPYRAAGTDEDRHRKDIASMARAGFSFAIIKKVLGGEVPDEELF